MDCWSSRRAHTPACTDVTTLTTTLALRRTAHLAPQCVLNKNVTESHRADGAALQISDNNVASLVQFAKLVQLAISP